MSTAARQDKATEAWRNAYDIIGKLWPRGLSLGDALEAFPELAMEFSVAESRADLATLDYVNRGEPFDALRAALFRWQESALAILRATEARCWGRGEKSTVTVKLDGGARLCRKCLFPVKQQAKPAKKKAAKK